MAGIKTIGVCGAGVMGSQLAAFFASAGFETLLFDLNQELSDNGVQGALKARPPAFYDKGFAERITACNYDDHVERFGECDWIIEAIAERIEWKRDLYARIQPALKADAVLSSNTSGLHLHELAQALSDDVRERFLITHFFNPPRYMRLVEMVPGERTREDVFRDMTAFIGDTLGKGVVFAKDTPNFVANRVGIYGMMLALELTARMRLSVEQVDALTGPVMGRPKSATYRTADLVGLDTLALVAQTSYDKGENDESREIFKPPQVLQGLLERKSLGSKTGAGFYKKEGKEILALDFESMDYRPRGKPRMDGIGVARRYTDVGKKFHALVHNPDTAGEFAWELTIGTISYAARRLGEIADDVVNVDRAMQWGFAWALGPFQTWDAIGIEKSVRRMEREGKPVPPAVQAVLDSGRSGFYDRDDAGARRYFDVASNSAQPIPVAPEHIVLSDRKARGFEILRNWSSSLVDIGDGVACVEFHSALQPEFNPIDGAVLDTLQRSLIEAEQRGLKGLVISHDGAHFSVGANLALILDLVKAGQFGRLDQVSKMLQDITQAIKYAPFPVVAAPFGMCLGGGYETIGACRKVVALAELYCGAVEVGVGLIPGGGGTLRMLTTQTERHPPMKLGPMVPVQKAFEVIAFAKVSGSAHEAKKLGYLDEEDEVVLSKDHQIARAREVVLELADGYEVLQPPELIPPGEGGRLAIRSVVDGFVKSGAISEHDALLGNTLAYVMTGGERANGIDVVEEQYMLDIERDAFVKLAGEPKSQARMAHMLKTGKPLRN
jgi:3-hydroxyacyl-CoA dehydrogenase